MDVNAINSNAISGLNVNNNSSLQLNKAQPNYKIGEQQSSDELNLNISNAAKQRSDFSTNIQSLNDGIAMSKISQVALDKQQDYLKNIETKLENIDTLDNKNDIKKSINEDLRAFNKISYETSYKKEALLVQNYYDDKNSIDVSTSSNNFSIEKPNISTVANTLFETVNNNDLNIPQNVSNAKVQVSNFSNELTNLSAKFEDFSKQLEDKVSESIKDQNTMVYKNSIDFAKESSDFSKTNISANAGYLAASQANIVQEQSVRLLS